MKLYLIFFVQLFLSFNLIALECPNFSGQYKTEESEVFTMIQNDCTTVRWIDDVGEKYFKADGEWHFMHEEGGIKAHSRSRFAPDTLYVEVKMDYGAIEIPEGYPDFFRLEFRLNRNGHLVETIRYGDTTQIQTFRKFP